MASWALRVAELTISTAAAVVTPDAEVAATREGVVAISIAAGTVVVGVVSTITGLVEEVLVHLGSRTHEAEEPAGLYESVSMD